MTSVSIQAAQRPSTLVVPDSEHNQGSQVLANRVFAASITTGIALGVTLGVSEGLRQPGGVNGAFLGAIGGIIVGAIGGAVVGAPLAGFLSTRD